ncbi:MAG: hypothetical protein K9J81_10865 [Desulfohalobiaceae bacterium]|nr:hypothetical protein [Desulfohalobiaceae bacterium]
MNQESQNVSQDATDATHGAEPWEEWEGKLVKYSLIIGVLALIVLGALINYFILH